MVNNTNQTDSDEDGLGDACGNNHYDSYLELDTSFDSFSPHNFLNVYFYFEFYFLFFFFISWTVDNCVAPGLCAVCNSTVDCGLYEVCDISANICVGIEEKRKIK